MAEPPGAPPTGGLPPGAGWGVALASTAGMLAWLARAGRTAEGDMGHLVAVELRLAQLLADGEAASAVRHAWALSMPHPPLGYLPGVASALLLGFAPWVPLISMGLTLLLCWDALRRLWAGAALWSWLALLSSPLVWGAVEQHSRDLVAGAVALQAVSWLVASQGFSRRGASIAFGLWLGVGFLTKYTFPIFLVGTCGLAALSLNRRPRWTRWGNLGLAFGGWLLVAGAWSWRWGRTVLAYASHSASDAMVAHTSNFRDPATLESLVYYPLALREALSLPGLVVVGAAAVEGLRRRAPGGPVALPLAGAAGGAALLSTLPEAIDRYALPGLALLVALLPALGRRGRALAAVVFLPMLVASAWGFRPGAATIRPSFDHGLDSAAELAWPASDRFRPSDLQLDAWHLDEVVLALRQAQGADRGTVGVLADRDPGAGPTFATILLEAARQGLRYDYATVGLADAAGQGAVMVGPLFDGRLPSRRFTALVAVHTPGSASAVAQWLRSHPGQELARVPGPRGGFVTVHRLDRPAGGLVP